MTTIRVSTRRMETLRACDWTARNGWSTPRGRQVRGLLMVLVEVLVEFAFGTV